MQEKEDVMDGRVEAVHKSASHTLSKPGQSSIRLLAGLGVEDDAHMGVTVQHRSRVAGRREIMRAAWRDLDMDAVLNAPIVAEPLRYR